MKGKNDEANADLQKILNTRAKNPFDLSMMAFARAATGDFDGALRECDLVRAERPLDRWMDVNAAIVYCLRAASPGNKAKDADISEAIRLLTEAAKEGMKNWAEIQMFPEIKILSGDTRFRELIKKQ